METIIDQIRKKVSSMYETVVDYFKADELSAKIYGLNNEELFTVERQNIDVVEPSKGVVLVVIELDSEVLASFCEKHQDEQPHFICRVDFWLNFPEEKLCLQSFVVKNPIPILNDKRNISIKYSFTSNYMEGKNGT